MKTFNILAVLSLVIAAAGIMFTNGEANAISVIGCVPLIIFVGILLVDGFKGWLKDRKSK